MRSTGSRGSSRRSWWAARCGHGWADAIDAELARGDVPAALVTGMRAAQMGPAFIRKLPRPLLERMTAAMMDRADGGLPSFRELASTLPYDGRIVDTPAESVDRYAAVTVPTLLLGGSKSPAYLKTALAALARTLPDARRVEIRASTTAPPRTPTAAASPSWSRRSCVGSAETAVTRIMSTSQGSVLPWSGRAMQPCAGAQRLIDGRGRGTVGRPAVTTAATGPATRHAEARERLLAQYAAIPAGEPVRLAKRTSNLFRPRDRTPTAGPRRVGPRPGARRSTRTRAPPTCRA